MLVLMTHKSWSILQCPSLPSVDSSSCFCDYKFQSGGLDINCFDEKSSFTIGYAINKQIKLECISGKPPYAAALFSNINATEISTFEFISCPLPNITFAKIFDGYRVNSFTFESRTNISNMKSEHLEDLKNLTLLSFRRSRISYISKELFQNLIQLRILRLNENGIEELEEDSFAHLTNLTNLELGGNLIHNLPDKIFSSAHNLEILYLYNNKLTKLSEHVFKSLQSLKVLDLSNNHLEDLPPAVFEDLVAVEKINLRNNKLKNLPENLFKSTLKLKWLELSNNVHLDVLPENLLFGLVNLENISMNSCNISRIPPHFFSQVTKLRMIQMSNNGINYLPGDLLQHNPNLETFLVDYNNLVTLPPELFKKQFKLEILGISKNKLHYLPKNIFNNLIKLKVINLSFNNITELESNIFRNMQSLEEFQISNNYLRKIDNLGIGNLKKIDISKNRLTAMPEFNWDIYLYLEELNLQYNNITLLSIPYLYSEKMVIKLGWNNISFIDISQLNLAYYTYKEESVSSLETIKYPPHWYLYPNPIYCDCHIYSFVSYLKKVDVPSDQLLLALFPNSDNLTCSYPKHLRGKRISKLSMLDFRCTILEDCPFPCNCYRTPDDKLVMNCSNRRLETFPHSSPWNTTVLDLSGNHLKSLGDLRLPIWQNLTEIYLDDNNITNFSGWNYFQKLTVLSLRNNLLRVLPLKFMNYTINLPAFQITLGDNPWQCDCETADFKVWLTENVRKIKDVNKVYCENKSDENGTMNVIRVSDDILCPLDNWPYRKQLITVTVIGVLLALLLFVTLILYYRNRNTVIAYFYFHFHFVFFCLYNEDELDEDKLFDAFVSYSSNDRDVMLTLLNELENKEPSFKLCIHERDWMPGNLISLNIVNSVQYSRRTILVLTEDFLESVWFQVEFQTAYHQMLEDKINRLIVIVKGQLPPKETLDKNLQAILSTKTYLVWGERWFWEKLRYAMPHKKKPMPRTDHRLVLSSKTANPDLLRSVEDKMSSFICLQDGRNQNSNQAKSEPKMIASSQTDSGIYSLDSISTENIISESDEI